MATIQVKGIEELLLKFEHIRPNVVAALKAGAQDIEGIIKTYPPATLSNDPMMKHWYERGYGPKWHTKSGAIHGRKTSKMLGRKWTIGEKDEGLTWIVGNNVKYGPYVQDKEHQAPVHKRHGWETIQDVAHTEGPRVVELIWKAINKALEG
jgi:hypothetical protein